MRTKRSPNKSEFSNEIWSKFYEDDEVLYYISTKGKVIRIKQEDWEKCTPILQMKYEIIEGHSNAYGEVEITINHAPVILKKVMMQQFTRNWYEGAIIAHIDGDKLNNHIQNLKIINRVEITRSPNKYAKYKIKTKHKDKVKTFYSIKDAADYLGISFATAKKILLEGKTPSKWLMIDDVDMSIQKGRFKKCATAN